MVIARQFHSTHCHLVNRFSLSARRNDFGCKTRQLISQ